MINMTMFVTIKYYFVRKPHLGFQTMCRQTASDGIALDISPVISRCRVRNIHTL